MSAPKKLRAATQGQPVSEVTRFKQLWRTQLSDEQKAQFIGWFSEAATSLAEIRARVQSAYGVRLKHDSQLSGEGALRDWCWQELRNQNEAERAALEELELIQAGLSGEALREALLEKFKRRAFVQGDAKLGLAAVDRDLKAQQVHLDSRRLVLLEKKAAAYDRAQAALTAAKESKGGLTPETLRKIETELKLL